MYIQTIQFKDVRAKDFTIQVSPVDTTDREDTTMYPNGLWYHYDTSKYSLEEAKQDLIYSYIDLQNKSITDATANISAILRNTINGRN